MAETSVLWFRRDLRVRDNPALAEATALGDRVLGVFVLDPALINNAGSHRLKFLYDSLRVLNEEIGGCLLVARGRPRLVIPRIAAAVSASYICVAEDFSPYGRSRDKRVIEALDDVEWVPVGSAYAVSPGRIAKNDGSPYKVFTPFYRAWQERGWHSPARTSAETATWLDPREAGDLPAVDIPDVDVDLGIRAGERAAWDQWKNFIAQGISGYRTNRDRPDVAATSRMSAYLKYGNIHPRTLLADLTAHRSDDAAAYMRELAFRDFYADVLYNWPDSRWHNWNRDFDAVAVDTDSDADRRFGLWTQGRTGFPIVDAGMRQLLGEGFVHNRVRMIVASFLVKDLHLPWQWGARHFLHHLIDGDIASNQHGWQWAAGCGTDAAPYFRVFNPTTQGRKFDPSGDYVRRWVPELRSLPDKAVHAPGDDRPDGYPVPMVDHATERQEALSRYGRITRRS